MSDFEGQEYSCQRDLIGESFNRCTIKIPGIFNDDVHSSSLQHSRDRPRPYMVCEDELYASVPCPHTLPQSSLYHSLNLPGLAKNEPHSWTHGGAAPYGMSPAEVSDAVASISAEVEDGHTQQACSTHESDGDLRLCNQLDLGQSQLTVLMSPQDQSRKKLPVCTSNVCQVMCSGHGLGQMVVLNHSSPDEMFHTSAVGCGPSGLKPPWCSQSGLTLPPQQCLLQGEFSQSLCPVHADTVGRRLEGQTSGSSRVSLEKSKKPCNCTKSQCLKLYCDCFANGEVCSNCNCVNCCNNMAHESERCRAIKICLDRNPDAFHPKIDIRKRGYWKGRHTKGCNCKRSGCLKNYCECYEANIMCSSTCKCVGCRNYEGSPVRECTGWDSHSSIYNLYSTKCPLSCITPDVVDATCGCLLVQAEEAEKDGCALSRAEGMILEEFGQCLTQIVHSIFKSTGVQW